MLLKLTTVIVAFLVWVPVASAWSWPVQGPVLQPFSYDEVHPYAAGQHRGIDIGATATGDPVVAPASGTVSFAGVVPTSGESLTIETADGYSVTLTHLGSIGLAAGASVAEGDAVATVGPSGTAEQSVPYLHLGIRRTADPLGYLDPLGFLPAPAQPPVTTTPSPAPQPVTKPAPVAAHPRGGGLVMVKPAAVPHDIAAPAGPTYAAKPAVSPTAKPTVNPTPGPAAHTFRVDAPQIRRPVAEPVASGVPVVVSPFVHAIEAEPLALSIAPAVVAVLIALATVFARSRLQALVPARSVALRKELPLRHAA